MNFCFNQRPERGEAIELWVTKLEGGGTITQFNGEGPAKKAAGIKKSAPGGAAVVGPFVLISQDKSDEIDQQNS